MHLISRRCTSTKFRIKQWLRKHEKLIVSQNNELVEANEKKRILLMEIHHRVKNNLQLLIGLLALKSQKTDDLILLLDITKIDWRLMGYEV